MQKYQHTLQRQMDIATIVQPIGKVPIIDRVYDTPVSLLHMIV